jgi:uncharacterized protein YndB with AHSA1/START domain
MATEQLQSGTTTVTANKDDLQLVVERVFDAPRELVWKAFTEPEHMARWWGPRGWNTTNERMEVKPGGVWHYCMRGPGGEESWGKAVYREVIAPSRLVYVDVFSDSEGNTNENMPEMLITTEFIAEGNKTRVRSSSKFAAAEQLEAIVKMGVVQGITETWDRLAEYLPSMA